METPCSNVGTSSGRCPRGTARSQSAHLAAPRARILLFSSDENSRLDFRLLVLAAVSADCFAFFFVIGLLQVDRDPVFLTKVRAMLRREGIGVARLPARIQNLNAYPERFIGSVRRVPLQDCPAGRATWRRPQLPRRGSSSRASTVPKPAIVARAKLRRRILTHEDCASSPRRCSQTPGAQQASERSTRVHISRPEPSPPLVLGAVASPPSAHGKKCT